MDREEKVQFVAHFISELNEVGNSLKLQEVVRNLTDEELDDKFEFAIYLLDK